MVQLVALAPHSSSGPDSFNGHLVYSEKFAHLQVIMNLIDTL